MNAMHPETRTTIRKLRKTTQHTTGLILGIPIVAELSKTTHNVLAPFLVAHAARTPRIGSDLQCAMYPGCTGVRHTTFFIQPETGSRALGADQRPRVVDSHRGTGLASGRHTMRTETMSLGAELRPGRKLESGTTGDTTSLAGLGALNSGGRFPAGTNALVLCARRLRSRTAETEAKIANEARFGARLRTARPHNGRSVFART